MGIPWWFKATTSCFHCQVVKFQSLSSYENKDPISCVGRTKKKKCLNQSPVRELRSHKPCGTDKKKKKKANYLI